MVAACVDPVAVGVTEDGDGAGAQAATSRNRHRLNMERASRGVGGGVGMEVGMGSPSVFRRMFIGSLSSHARERLPLLAMVDAPEARHALLPGWSGPLLPADARAGRWTTA